MPDTDTLARLAATMTVLVLRGFRRRRPVADPTGRPMRLHLRECSAMLRTMRRAVAPAPAQAAPRSAS